MKNCLPKPKLQHIPRNNPQVVLESRNVKNIEEFVEIIPK